MTFPSASVPQPCLQEENPLPGACDGSCAALSPLGLLSPGVGFWLPCLPKDGLLLVFPECLLPRAKQGYALLFPEPW